jgi:hypothetical protein
MQLVPPILRTPLAVAQVLAGISCALLVQEQVIVEKMRRRDGPVKVLGLEVQANLAASGDSHGGHNVAADACHQRTRGATRRR